MANERGNNLTLAGMALTIVLSVGGTWAANTYHSGVIDAQLSTLMQADTENKKVNETVYKLEQRAESMEASQITLWSDMRVLDAKVDTLEVTTAQSTQAINNLVQATEALTKTTQDLVIEVTKLQK